MKEFREKVAVIIGATNPLGVALAQKAFDEGMRLALSDTDIEALEMQAAQLKDQGAEVLAIPADVAQPEQVQAMAMMVLQAYGEINLVCNNAGKFVDNSVWESAPPDWQWLLNVNLWGVINGLHIFTPVLISQDSQSHIFNTAYPGFSSLESESEDQAATIRAVVSISRSLAQGLKEQDNHIGVSVLCPKWASQSDADTEIELPPELLPGNISFPTPPPEELSISNAREINTEELSPPEIAAQIFEAIHSDQFYILV